MQDLIASVAAKKAELDTLLRRAPHGVRNLQRSHDLELTHTSNAIEGNTLTAVETTLVIEQGVTIGGKPLRGHLEALDHFDALGYVRAVARERRPVAELDVRNLHRLVMLRSAPDMAGRYADQGRFVLTDAGRAEFPSPAEAPALMAAFSGWLGTAPDRPEAAFAAHRDLVGIHPFNDGNDRTARLLMNLVLIRGGYPPVAVRPVDRVAYLGALQQAHAGQGAEAFAHLLCARLDETLDEYVAVARQALPR